MNNPLVTEQEMLDDVSPFTVMATFNRGSTNDNRTRIAQQLAKRFEIELPAPVSFDGIPTMDNRKVWFLLQQNCNPGLSIPV